jgi:pimeloyl-ACP methyl ester carboxylesterase
MTAPTERSLCALSPHGFFRMTYHEWGDPDAADVVVCVHGLTRTGRDFDELAATLAADFRVLCPDIPGRGRSDWLQDPHDYAFPTYVSALTALIARSGAERVLWVGTSMGGLLGITLAAQPRSPVAALVVNDVGPVIEAEALARIGAYVGLDPKFDSFAALEAYLRQVAAPFGPLTDAQWHHLAATACRELPDGRFALGYDPAIAVPFREAAKERTDLWPLWDAIRCPTLLVRGGDSDLLSADTAAEMTTRGPRPRLVVVPGVGHAPMLLDPAQIAPVAQFLRAHRAAPPSA